ncbi:ornithine cyclodeaminase family protein [Paraflavitalea pollutisoli]|uniref:ornithine cyclodeaminase family protein n=1 Tax=Paraflavitalea pollutisoli TaxID=3034143 RepID=UPI0023EBD354|nr:ornithine cyclodeaminase family protein [Paraflavitalea sp. H1-2-19X]
MLIISNQDIEASLDYAELIANLREIFSGEFTMPLRHHHFYGLPGGIENTLILMPSWTNEYMGIKQVVVAPDNATRDLPSIHAQYTLMSAVTGVPLAMMNASLLTSFRTACASALAANYLATRDASVLLVVGTGKVAYHMVAAHNSVRDYKRMLVWGRNETKAAVMQQQLQQSGHAIEIVTNLEEAVRAADVISCATMSQEPLIKGAWLKPGQHLDLVGSYKPATREVDDDAVTRSTLFVDARAGALHESGELAIPIKNGLITPEAVKADLVELCKGIHPGRTSPEEITLYKSVGLAIEDLAAALLVYKRVSAKGKSKEPVIY